MLNITIGDGNGDTEPLELQHWGEGLFALHQLPEGESVAQQVIISIDQIQNLWASVARFWGPAGFRPEHLDLAVIAQK